MAGGCHRTLDPGEAAPILRYGHGIPGSGARLYELSGQHGGVPAAAVLLYLIMCVEAVPRGFDERHRRWLRKQVIPPLAATLDAWASTSEAVP